jgi:hypothetical protein
MISDFLDLKKNTQNNRICFHIFYSPLTINKIQLLLFSLLLLLSLQPRLFATFVFFKPGSNGGAVERGLQPSCEALGYWDNKEKKFFGHHDGQMGQKMTQF